MASEGQQWLGLDMGLSGLDMGLAIGWQGMAREGQQCWGLDMGFDMGSW